MNRPKFNKPLVGSVVTFKTEFPSYVLGRDKDIAIYENKTVLRSEPYDLPDTFRVRGDGKINVRIISLKYVTELKVGGMNQDPDTEESTSNARTVIIPSKSGNDNYMVRIEGRTPTSCTCVGFQYRKTCRHLGEALKRI